MMRNKEEHEIFNWYPELCEYGLLTKKECNEPIAWYGIECGRGWYKIIRATIDTIDRYCKKYDILDDIRIAQIKEKFAGLRIYINYSNNTLTAHYKAIEAIINEGAVEASKTCEVCGTYTGESNLKGEGYVYNMCDTCWAKSDKSKRPKDLAWQQ